MLRLPVCLRALPAISWREGSTETLAGGQGMGHLKLRDSLSVPHPPPSQWSKNWLGTYLGADEPHTHSVQSVSRVSL